MTDADVAEKRARAALERWQDLTANSFDSYEQQAKSMGLLSLPAGYFMDEDDVEGCDGDGI